MSPELPFLSLLGFFGTRTALPWFVHVRCPLSGLELESERPDRHNTRSLVLSNKPAFLYYAAFVRLTGGVGLTSRKHPRETSPKNKTNTNQPPSHSGGVVICCFMEDPGGRQDQGPVSIMLDQAKDRHSMPVRESGMSGGCRVVWSTFEQFCHDWYSGP